VWWARPRHPGYGVISEHMRDVITDTCAGLWVARLPVLRMAMLSTAVKWCASQVLALMTNMHRAAWPLIFCPPHSPEHGLLL